MTNVFHISWDTEEWPIGSTFSIIRITQEREFTELWKYSIFTLLSVKKGKKYKTAKPEETAENKLSRNFYTTSPNKKWVTDVTEFKIPNSHKKLYLSVILDLYDRYPIAFVISGRNDNRLVFKTFDKANVSYVWDFRWGLPPILLSRASTKQIWL